MIDSKVGWTRRCCSEVTTTTKQNQFTPFGISRASDGEEKLSLPSVPLTRNLLRKPSEKSIFYGSVSL